MGGTCLSLELQLPSAGSSLSLQLGLFHVSATVSPPLYNCIISILQLYHLQQRHHSDLFENCGWRLFQTHPLGRQMASVVGGGSDNRRRLWHHPPPRPCDRQPSATRQEVTHHSPGRRQGAATLLCPYSGVTLQNSQVTASARVVTVDELGLSQKHCSFLLV